MAAARVRIALCGKDPGMVHSFIAMMKPEYEVVHHCNDSAVAKKEFAAVLRGEKVNPATGSGSNAQSDGSKPFRAVVVGAGFRSSEVEEMRRVDVLKDLVWLYPSSSRASYASGPPSMEQIVGRAKKALEENGIGGSKEVKGGIYDY